MTDVADESSSESAESPQQVLYRHQLAGWAGVNYQDPVDNILCKTNQKRRCLVLEAVEGDATPCKHLNTEFVLVTDAWGGVR